MKSLECFTHLPCVKGCMKESIRLSPPVTGTVRVTNSDLVIGEYKIPKGTIVNTGSDIICHIAEHFNDPLEFKPERWLRCARRDIAPFSFILFGFGARMCIGKRFAEQGIMLMMRFQVELVDPSLKLDRVTKVLYSPDKLVPVCLTERDSSS